jgi:SAM-dependent methyltransferase
MQLSTCLQTIALSLSHTVLEITPGFQDLPFPENTFDVVHAHQVLQHIADPVQAFKEMRRVHAVEYLPPDDCP